MATIDTSRVRKDLRNLIAQSKGVKKIVKSVLEDLEENLSQFEKLKYVSPIISRRYKNLVIRKAKVINQRHDFRIIFAHWTFRDDNEHVDVILVFPREEGYEIDWDWMADSLS